ncbi:MAG: hypothetical protein ACRBBN_03610 [Methyloligellaceae bacterium]
MQYLQRSIISDLKTILILIGVVFLSSCAQKGDFGRPGQSRFQEIASAYAHDFFLGPVTGAIEPKSGQYPGAPFGLTKHEIIVRDAAVHFNLPLTKMHRPPGKELSPTAYAEYMTSSEFTHGKSRTTFISAQIKSDFVWLKRFIASARKVKIDDGERAYYLQTRKFGITNQDHLRTYSRIKDNELIVYGVFKDLDDRVASYAYAIDRTPLETPGASTEALKTALQTLRKELALARVQYDKLARRIARYRVNFPKHRKYFVKKKVGHSEYYIDENGERRKKSRNNNNDTHNVNMRVRSGGDGSEMTDGQLSGNSFSTTYQEYDSRKDNRREKIRRSTLKNVSPKLMKLRMPQKVRYKKAKPIRPVKKNVKKSMPLPTKRMLQADSWPMVITPAQK